MGNEKPKLKINEKVQLHVRVTQTHIDILNELIEKKEGINSYSEAVRYAVLCLKDDINTEDLAKNVQRKMNAMSKNIDTLIEMTAGGFDAQNIKAIGKGKDTYIYQDARKNVESEIQRTTTISSNFKKSNMVKPELEMELKEEEKKKTRSLFK